MACPVCGSSITGSYEVIQDSRRGSWVIGYENECHECKSEWTTNQYCELVEIVKETPVCVKK